MLFFSSSSLNLAKHLKGRTWRKIGYEAVLLVTGPVQYRSCTFAGGWVSSTPKDGVVMRKDLSMVGHGHYKTRTDFGHLDLLSEPMDKTTRCKMAGQHVFVEKSPVKPCSEVPCGCFAAYVTQTCISQVFVQHTGEP